MTSAPRSSSSENEIRLPAWFPGPLALLAWVVLALAFLRPELPLTDQATGRHLTTGKVILEERGIPEHDPLSYLYADRPYLNFEWLFDTGSRLILDHIGLPALVFLTYIIFTLTLCFALRFLLENRISLPVALAGTALLAMGNYVHFLTRPVICSYFFLILVVWLWNRVLDDRSTRSVLLLPLVYIFWANIHPGFASGLLFMASSLGGALLDAGRKNWIKIRPACLIFGLCALATLVNPFGWHLHQLVLHQVLHSRSLGQVQEFLPPSFAHLNGAVLAFLCILVSAFFLGLRQHGRLTLRLVLPTLIFLYFAFKVQRHILLFLPIILLPWARMLDQWLQSFSAFRERFRSYTQLAGQSRHDLAWAFAAIVLLGLLFLPAMLPKLRVGSSFFSPSAQAFVAEHIGRFQKPFTSTIQAGNLLFYFHPQLKVSFDDRVDFYQDEDSFAHLSAVNAQGDWRGFLRKFDFDSAFLYPTDPLAEALRHDPAWREIYSDASLLIFEKKD